MNNYTDTKFYKTVIINRAVSGSGKSTLSKCVTNALRAKGLPVSVHSTDDFFMKDGRYAFNLADLNENHLKNQKNFADALERGDDVVICDNMNLRPCHSEPYTNAARKYNYRIIFINFLPRELEKHLAAQKVTPEKPDAHGLTKELLERFIKNFNDYNDLLDKKTVRDSKRHKLLRWNDDAHESQDTGELSPYFDLDAVITIAPDQYNEQKKTLPDAILKMITEPEKDFRKRCINS